MVPIQHIKTTYNDKAFANLCTQFEIPKHIETDIRDALEDSAAIWRWYNAPASERTNPSLDRRDLKKLATKAIELQAAFSKLSDSAQGSVRHEYSNLDMEGTHSIIIDNEINESYPILRVPNRDGTEGILSISIDETLKLLDALKGAAENAAENLNPAPKGAKRDHALRMWITNISLIWEDILGRPFTRDVTNDGMPISEAAQFCVSAFTHIDSKVIPSRILNEMKHEIIRLNKKRKSLEELKTETPPNSSSE